MPLLYTILTHEKSFKLSLFYASMLDKRYLSVFWTTKLVSQKATSYLVSLRRYTDDGAYAFKRKAWLYSLLSRQGVLWVRGISMTKKPNAFIKLHAAMTWGGFGVIYLDREARI